MLTDQEMFDTVARHLLKQREISEMCDGTCAYRGPNGLKCAVGCLIPDKDYEGRYEGIALYGEGSVKLEKQADESDLFQYIVTEISDNFNLVAALQELHDSERVNAWPNCLRALASDWDLSYAVVDELDPVDVE
jgi:hypothetical protein